MAPILPPSLREKESRCAKTGECGIEFYCPTGIKQKIDIMTDDIAQLLQEYKSHADEFIFTKVNLSSLEGVGQNHEPIQPALNYSDRTNLFQALKSETEQQPSKSVGINMQTTHSRLREEEEIKKLKDLLNKLETQNKIITKRTVEIESSVLEQESCSDENIQENIQVSVDVVDVKVAENAHFNRAMINLAEKQRE